MDEVEGAWVTLVHAWSESVLQQVERVRAVRQEYAPISRQLDREWDDALADQLSVIWRRSWTEEHTLVWSMHQLDRWVRRLAQERGEEPPPENQLLTDLRNTLEHLDEAIFDEDDVAEPGVDRTKNRSLRRLPGGKFYIATGGVRVFGTVALDEVEQAARDHLTRLEDEADQRREEQIEAAGEAYIDYLIDTQRGK